MSVSNNTDDLTYSVNAVSDLYIAKDSGSMSARDADPTTSEFANRVKISAKNAAGDTVAVPNTITAITSSNPAVAVVALGEDSSTGPKAYVLGNKKGTTTLSVSYLTNKGVQKQASITVNVKDLGHALAVTSSESR